tara:strand:- start:5630 stop:6613 length:984 start_codon:yes stop_codon:yes gene_type:complete
MSKILVIDGLARSGTTLLSSLIHSQETSKCYRGIFHEFYACDIGKGKRDYALCPLIESNKEIKIVQKYNFLSNFLLTIKKNMPNLGKLQKFTPIFLSLELLKKNSLKVINKKNQIDYFSINEWDNLIEFLEIKNYQDLDNFYQNLSKEFKVDLLAFRWNQGYSYINKWLRNPNHYWVSVIRNPISRSLSDHKVFKENHRLGVSYTKNFAKIISEVDNPNHLTIYFDDLILNPKRQLERIFQMTGLKLPNINLKLVQQSGENYKIESSDIISKNIPHTMGRKFERFEKEKLIVDNSEMPEKFIEQYNKIIEMFPIFQPYSKNGRLYKF